MRSETEAEARSRLKQRIKREAAKLGMNLTGFASVERWREYGDLPEEFWPQTIWPWSRTVIVMAVQIYLPMLETTPSVVYSELYNTTNRMLDESACRLANFLNQKRFRAHFFPRDCYGDISVLVKKPEAAFSHVMAGRYAGIGTIGMNHTLLTREYGPRVRLVSVITDLEVRADPVMTEDVCVRCGMCAKRCPMKAFAQGGGPVYDMDKRRCAGYHQKLKDEFRYPCGLCTAVCPVGEDRKRYGASSVTEEGAAHCRNFGSRNAIE